MPKINLYRYIRDDDSDYSRIVVSTDYGGVVLHFASVEGDSVNVVLQRPDRNTQEKHLLTPTTLYYLQVTEDLLAFGDVPRCLEDANEVIFSLHESFQPSKGTLQVRLTADADVVIDRAEVYRQCVS